MCFYVVAIITCLCVDINHAVDTMHWCHYRTWIRGVRWSITNRLLSRHSSHIHPYLHPMFHENWPLAVACWHTSQCPRVKILLKLWTMWCDRVVIKIFSVRCKDNWCQHHSVSRYGDTAAVMEDGSIQYAEFVVEGVLMLVVSCFGVILNIIRYRH